MPWWQKQITSSTSGRVCRLAASEPSGTSFAPSIRQSWCSHGSRTSTKNNFSPQSSRAFTSACAISNSSIYFPFQIGGRFFIKQEFLRARLASSSASSSIRVVELGTGTLLALKLRRPLFEERANSLVAIFRQETTHLFLHFIVERLGQFFFSAGKKRPLPRAHAHPRTPPDLFRKRLHFRFELRKRSDRKSTRLNSSHHITSYPVFCLKTKKNSTYTLIPI